MLLSQIIQKNQLRNPELRLPYIGPILQSFWRHPKWSPQFREVNVSLQRGKETHVPFPSCETCLLFCLAPHVSDNHEGVSWLKCALCLDEQVGLGKSLWFGSVEGEVLQDKGKRSLRENRTCSSWAPWRRRTDGKLKTSLVAHNDSGFCWCAHCSHNSQGICMAVPVMSQSELERHPLFHEEHSYAVYHPVYLPQELFWKLSRRN